MVKIRSPREVSKEIDRLLEKGRRFLPSFRGGSDPNPQRGAKRRKPKPLTKTYQHTPTIPTTPAPTGDAVRWRPPSGFGDETMQETTRERNIRLFEERKQAQPQYVQDVEDVLNMQPDPESALLELFDVAESTQDQELENALAMISARRPRQFSSRARSQQFSRLNLVPAPKKKRKVSAYSKRFGIELKKLKKLHPRTKVQNLMKKAHRRTRAAMKKK